MTSSVATCFAKVKSSCSSGRTTAVPITRVVVAPAATRRAINGSHMWGSQSGMPPGNCARLATGIFGCSPTHIDSNPRASSSIANAGIDITRRVR